MPRLLTIIACIFWSVTGFAQNPIYENLPVGKYAVGFKVITITDSSRAGRPAYNYLGEKNKGDLSKKITIHLWYPAEANSAKTTLTYGDYCYSHLLTATDEVISADLKNAQIRGRRTGAEGWFGKATDEAWKQLIETKMLARTDATQRKEKFPLLIGMLRPLSTTITNEMLASNGYVIAMIKSGATGSFSQAALADIPDMQYALTYLGKKGIADIQTLGAFGFSGSGFAQVLFTMYDYRVRALADLESGIYMEGLFQALSLSNYYDPSKLRVPFLHIFSRDLSKQEKYIDEFEKKAKFSKRYRLLLNQPALHHWDFAAEGYTSCVVLKNRGDAQTNIQRSFETASVYLLNFFNAELKGDTGSRTFLSARPVLPNISPSLWDVSTLSASKPAPDKDEFEYVIRTKGIREALAIVHTSLANDSATNLVQGFALNTLGYTFLNEKKYEEAIGVFTLNIELHPEEANFFDSLAEAYEIAGDHENKKKMSGKVMQILNKKATLSDAEKSLKDTAERRAKE
jgi:tetratricopeptide (TPR) repeat protein